MPQRVMTRPPHSVPSRFAAVRPVLDAKPTCHRRGEIDAFDPHRTCSQSGSLSRHRADAGVVGCCW